jgi:SWI/SNF-related matrix-associated actin-dependent regulator of chromatin subfamily A-like protein 1
MPRKNTWSGSCKTCKKRVGPKDGFVRPEGTVIRQGVKKANWVTYCQPHWPEKVESERRELTAEGELYYPYDPEALPLLRSLPGGRWLPAKKCRTVSLHMGDRVRLLDICDKLAIKVAASLKILEDTLQAQAAGFKGLYPFQITGVNFLARKEYAILGDDMGLGKTVEALCALPAGERTIVIAPACVKYNWAAEIKKWRPDFTIHICEGRGSFVWPKKGQVVIINYALLPKKLAPLPKNGRPKWDVESKLPQAELDVAAETTVIIDEVHKVCNPKTNRSKATRGLSMVSKARWGLTGTVMTNRPDQLYGVLSSLDMAFQTFGSFKNFKRLFNAYSDRWGGISWGKPNAEVPERLRRVMLRRTRDEALPDLPKKTYTTLTVGIGGRLKNQLDKFEQDYGFIVENGDLPPFEEFSKLRAEIARQRIGAMEEWIEEHEEQKIPVLVFSAHKAPVEAAGNRDGWACITGDTPSKRRQEIVEEFQAGNLKGVALGILSGGVGLTLTRAWKSLFVDLDWLPCNNAQAEDRTCRIGQTSNKVEIVRMRSDHVLEIHVWNLIVKKTELVQGAVEREFGKLNRPPQGESDEEFAARLALIAKAGEEAAKAEANKRKAGSQNRSQKLNTKLTGRSVERKYKVHAITPNREAAIREAFQFMISVCDGAIAKDAQGFNAPDACLAHWMDVSLPNEGDVESAYHLLLGYRRQCSKLFPAVFKK